MSIKVIGAGFGRTGTLSLKIALETLEIGPCQHWVELNRNPVLVQRWLDALRKLRAGTAVNWEVVFEGYAATVDWPACSFVGELKRAYPDAKVVLTVREPSSWYDSVSETLLPLYQSMPRWLCALVPPLGAIQSLSKKVIWGKKGIFEGQFEDRARSIAIFEEHNQKLSETIPARDLLVFDVSEGYGPLCNFLGLPVPETPFPHANDRASIKRNIRLLYIARRVLGAAGIASALGFLYWIS